MMCVCGGRGGGGLGDEDGDKSMHGKGVCICGVGRWICIRWIRVV